MYDNEVKFVATFFSGFWIDTRIYNLHLFLNRQYFVFIPAGRGSTGGAASMENRAGNELLQRIQKIGTLTQSKIYLRI